MGLLNYFTNLTQPLIPKTDSIRQDKLVVVGASPKNLSHKIFQHQSTDFTILSHNYQHILPLRLFIVLTCSDTEQTTHINIQVQAGSDKQ